VNCWLVKQEPSAYSWDDFVTDGRTAWTGVRNFQARNNLRSMKLGDRVLFYHSIIDKSVVGEAEVIRESYPDPTSEEGGWVCVDLKPVRALPKRISLEQIRADKKLAKLALVRSPRLSVMPVSSEEYERILELSQA
jgi:predicted RNA-binding protein with PUA-like domain